MTSRERVYATIDFQGPDRVPRDLWTLPAAWFGREDALRDLLQRYPTDLAMAQCTSPHMAVGTTHLGTYTDAWGCEWLNLVEGIIGEVKHPVFEDFAAMQGYQWPVAGDTGWAHTAAFIAEHREKFMLGFGGNPFERMQFLRGTENLYVDLAEESDEVYELRDRVFAYYRGIVERWVTLDVDAVSFNDDWGSQRSLLIRPAQWRSFFKPKYKELFDIVLDAGKRIFMHSDGYIIDIYPDLIELGVSALNSQVWCMGLDTVAPYAGQITFWGELDRQHLMPYGTPTEIHAAAAQMKAMLYRNGGLIGEAEVDHLTSLENIEAFLSAWK